MLNLPIKILKTIQIETEQATITFDTIATLVAQWDTVARVTSRHLVLIVNATSPDAVAKRAVEIELNGDSGATYNHQWMSGEAAVADADRQDGVNALLELVGADYPFAIPGTTYANAFGGGTILFPHAFNTTNHKVALALGGAVEDYVSAVVGRWASVAAITSLILAPDTGNFAAGSTISLGVIDEHYLVEEWISAGVGTAIFDNIPQGEGDLVIIGYARSSQAAVADEVLHYINDDGVAANYPAQELRGIGAGPPAAAFPINGECAIIPGQTAGINVFGALVVNYSQYTKDNHPHFLSASGYHSPTGPVAEVRLMSGRRANIEPINKIELDPTLGVNFFAESLLSLYRVPKRIIERFILTEDTPLITFDNIPQHFEDLILHVYARTDRAAAGDEVAFEINDDGVAANYDRQRLYGAAAAAAADRNAAITDWLSLQGNTAAVNAFAGGTTIFLGYAKTDRNKHCVSITGYISAVLLESCRWESNAAIYKLDLSPGVGPNFLAGSVFELEGILRREGLPPSEGMRI